MMTNKKSLCRLKTTDVLVASLILLIFSAVQLSGQNLLEGLGKSLPFKSKRISSFDREGGNRDALIIEPGKTAVLAEIKGPAAIHHIWVTVAAEPFYGRKLILRIYWDGENSASVEVPLGDFFGVGHGLNRNLTSIPVNNSSEGRARNCYWYMPFRKSAVITVTNEGNRQVDAFYYYIDYRELKSLKPGTPYFHAQYNQAFPCLTTENYVLLEARGRGHYVGAVYNVLQRTMGWWGEGDDMIYVDGEETPSLYGTGSEDYFSDAWGMREGLHPFYGCSIQEEDFQVGSKASVYRFHITDPVPFKKSIRVTIEHGHANDRSDYISSVAFWYQAEPHAPFPALPSVDKRLPFALEIPTDFVLLNWEKRENQPDAQTFVDKEKGVSVQSPRLATGLLSYYMASGKRYPLLRTENAHEKTKFILSFPVKIRDKYNLKLYLLKSPDAGNFNILKESPAVSPGENSYIKLASFSGYAEEKYIDTITIGDILLDAGVNKLILQVAGRDKKATASEINFVGFSLTPSARRFVDEWHLIGPFQASDMNYLYTIYPPEQELDLKKKYPGKAGAEVSWRPVKTEPNGYLRLTQLVSPNEETIAYCLAYVYSPKEKNVYALIGSDDGVRVWMNDRLVHTNPAYRGAYPDQDQFPVRLKKGWNKVLVKIQQGAGGWGLYFRLNDPDAELRWSLEPEEKQKK